MGGGLASDDRPPVFLGARLKRRGFDQRFGWLISVLQNQQLGEGGSNACQLEPDRRLVANVGRPAALGVMCGLPARHEPDSIGATHRRGRRSA